MAILTDEDYGIIGRVTITWAGVENYIAYALSRALNLAPEDGERLIHPRSWIANMETLRSLQAENRVPAEAARYLTALKSVEKWKRDRNLAAHSYVLTIGAQEHLVAAQEQVPWSPNQLADFFERSAYVLEISRRLALIVDGQYVAAFATLPPKPADPPAQLGRRFRR